MSYKQDPNDSTKQVPGSAGINTKDRIVNATPFRVQKTPNAVYIGDLSGDVAFFFGTSASFSAKAAVEDTTNSLLLSGSSHYTNFGTPAAGTILNIHPIAFSASNAGSSSVHFVYSSGLRTGPY
jgi:hypothetical protein